jgi:gamma-glutamylputrescine oxidase
MGAPSLWQAQDRWTGFPSLEADAAADVAVIGAGVSGCACALRLAELGLQAILLEASQVASGASGRNGGFGSAGTGLELPDAAELIGEPAAVTLQRMTEAALDDMLALAAEQAEASTVRRTGSLWLAGPDEAVTLRGVTAALAAAGVDCRQAPELVPPPMRPHYPAATVFPGNCELVPSRWVRALAGAAAGRGARVYERSPAVAIERKGSGWSVTTPAAAVRAQTVVVALDGLLPQLLPELRGIVYPVRGQMLATEPIADTVVSMPTHSDHGFFYSRPAADGRLVIGGGRWADLEAEYTDEERPTRPVQLAIERYMADRMGLASVRVTHRWAGIMGFSADLLPVVGELPGRAGLHALGGYSGVGNVQGFACGRMLADLLAGGSHPLAAALSPARFAVDGALRAPETRREQVESRALVA